jgi:hypothetical protein
MEEKREREKRRREGKGKGTLKGNEESQLRSRRREELSAEAQTWGTMGVDGMGPVVDHDCGYFRGSVSNEECETAGLCLKGGSILGKIVQSHGKLGVASMFTGYS